MRKELGSAYDKSNIFVVIYDTGNSITVNQVMS